jgi:hypothetical protein
MGFGTTNADKIKLVEKGKKWTMILEKKWTNSRKIGLRT